MAKIIFINRYFHPDHSATSQILSDLAFHLASRNHAVHVVTSRQLYDDPAAKLPARETTDGVVIHRVWTSRRGRGGLLGRALDYASFYASATIRAAAIAKRGDVVVAKTDPPLLSVPIAVAAKLKGASLVNWLQDLYPEVAVALDVRMPTVVFAIARRFRDWSVRAAVESVAIGDGMAARLRRIAAEASVHAIPNWTDEKTVRPVAPAGNALRHEWGLSDKFVVGYSGNLGRAHEIDTMLGAARELLSDDGFRFLFVGGGHLHEELQRRVAADDLTNIVVRPYQSRERLAESLSVADVHWLSLRPELDGLIVPSKLYGIAAVGRPIIVVSAKTGELARFVSDEGIGLSIEVGDTAGLVAALRKWRNDPEEREQLGARARALMVDRLSKSSALAAWESLLCGTLSASTHDRREKRTMAWTSTDARSR